MMRGTLCAACFVLAALCAPLPAHATTWYVTAGGTGTQDGTSWDNALPTVTAGLQKAVSGDTVQVWVGVYHERITLKSGVTLSGGHFFFGAWMWFWSILDGDHSGTVVTVPARAGTSTVMEGFTIQNGTGKTVGEMTYGGGIYCVDAKPTLRYNQIANNHADIGGGLYLSNAAADISLCHFINNHAVRGGGIYCQNGSPPIYICTFRRNQADIEGGAFAGSGTPLLVLACNAFEANSAPSTGSAITVNGGSVLNNTLLRNTGTASGSLNVAPGGTVAVANNIVAFNDSGISVAAGASATIGHNDVYANTAANYTGVPDPTGSNGNISSDPKLADPLVGDCTPCFGSPCIDAGDDSYIQTGWNDYFLHPRISGVAVDIGAAECVQTPPKALAIRVSPSGNDAFGGADWAHPKATVQAAIDSAIASDKEVWVAAGVYNERVKITNGNVMLYGGFAGNETARNQRNPAANASILDGSLGVESVVSIRGELNTQHQVDNRTVVDGFTIRNGRGTALTSTWLVGGGIYVSVAAPVISGNIIENCNALAADGHGGGVFVEVESPSLIPDKVQITCNTFRNNVARIGGGIYATYSEAFIRNNTFDGNQAVDYNSLPGFGGGIAAEQATITATCNTVLGNSVQGTGSSGGGIYCYQGSVVLRGNRIQQNTAGQFSAGIACASDAQILNNVLSGNQSAYAVGAASIQAGKVTLANNLIAHNRATAYAGGVWCNDADVNAYSNTFVDNSREALEVIATSGTRTYNVSSNIIASGPTGIAGNVVSPSTVACTNNCFYAVATPYSVIPAGTGDVYADPRFASAAADNYRLLSGSPCIDAGNDAAATGDWGLDGQPRVQGAHLDIGAYESPGLPVIRLANVIQALRIAAGLEPAGASSIAILNVVDAGASQGRIDLLDATRLARIVSGLP